MKRLLIEAHVWVWAQFTPHRLPTNALRAIEVADEVFVSAASAYEIAQKVRRQAWPEMDAGRLRSLVEESDGVSISPIGAEEAAAAGLLEWENRDPFDRLIAATAISQNTPLVTKDVELACFGSNETIWT